MEKQIIKSSHHRIIETARTYLGTPFHHQGRLKGVGVDCLGLLICIAQELSLTAEDGTALASQDALDYAHYPDEKRLYHGLMSQLQEISYPKAATIGLFEIDGSARHLALFGCSNPSFWCLTPESHATERDTGVKRQYNDGDLTLIHAYAPRAKWLSTGSMRYGKSV